MARVPWISNLQNLISMKNLLCSPAVSQMSCISIILYCLQLDSNSFVTVFKAPQCSLNLTQLLQAICIKFVVHIVVYIKLQASSAKQN